MRVHIRTNAGTHEADLVDNRLAYRAAAGIMIGNVIVDGEVRRVSKITPSLYIPGIMIAVLE